MRIIKDKADVNLVRVSIDMPYEIYKQMKIQLIERNCTIRTYILQSLIEKLAQEISYK